MADASSIDWKAYWAAQRARRAEPSSLVVRLFDLANDLRRADRALDDFFGDGLKLMAPDRAAQFEAIFPAKPPYFEIWPIADAIEKMANEWQGEIDAEEV